MNKEEYISKLRELADAISKDIGEATLLEKTDLYAELRAVYRQMWEAECFYAPQPCYITADGLQ